MTKGLLLCLCLQFEWKNFKNLISIDVKKKLIKRTILLAYIGSEVII